MQENQGKSFGKSYQIVLGIAKSLLFYLFTFYTFKNPRNLLQI